MHARSDCIDNKIRWGDGNESRMQSNARVRRSKHI